MTPIVVTPAPVAEFGSIILGDGLRELELVGAFTATDTLFATEFVAPVPVLNDTFATSRDMAGSVRTETKDENETGSGAVYIGAGDAAAFWDLYDDFADLIRSAHKRKGYLKVTYPGSAQVTLRLASIALSEIPTDHGLRSRRMQPKFAFTCQPYGELEPVTIVEAQTLTAPIDSVDLPSVPGHVPAKATATFTDASGQPRDDIEWGLAESFNDPDTYLIDASDFIVSGYSGTFDTDHVEGVAPSSWIALFATDDLPHVGRFKVKLRMRGDSARECQVRIAWHAGDDPLRSEQANLAVPHLNGPLIELDMGTVSIREVEGDHAWSLRVEVKGDGSSLEFTEILLIPTDRYGRARAPVAAPTPTVFAINDGFDQSDGALDGKTIPNTGGEVWDTTGDSGDYTVEDDYAVIYRDASADTTGRFALAGSDVFSTVTVRTNTSVLAMQGPSNINRGIVLRYGDANNWVLALLVSEIGPATYPVDETHSLVLLKCVAASIETVDSASLPLSAGSYGMQASIDSAGRYAVWLFAIHGEPGPTPLLSGVDADFATGQPLDEGLVGLNTYLNLYLFGFDDLRVLFYDFTVWESTPDHVTWPDRATIIDHQAAQRENEGGTRLGDVPRYERDRLFVPPATRNNLTSRLVVKQDRNDLAQLPVTDAADELTLDLEVTPRVILTSTP